MEFRQDVGILGLFRPKGYSSNLFDQTGHVERSERCLLCHLHHYGVTCSQSRSQFPCLHQQWEIPLAEKDKDVNRWHQYMGEMTSKEVQV